MELLENGTVAVTGVVKRAYPLRSLSSISTDEDSAEQLLDTFSPGVGPCGADATQLVTAVIEHRESFETCTVFFYDAWATKVQFLQRHYKVDIRGVGLVALEWEAGGDTEELRPCVIVAERALLKKALDRAARLFRFPVGVAIKFTYEEPQRLPESDQLRYLPPKIIQTRDIHTTTTPRLPPSNERGRGKRTLQQAVGGAAAYRYTALGDLVPGNADLYGIVVNTSLPKRSGGTDFYMSVSIVDESCPRRIDAVSINIFYPSIDKMPRILYVGDIIRFHKLRIQQYQDKLQGSAHPRATRYIVLRESSNKKLNAQTCSETWTFEESDERRSRELIAWARTSLPEDYTLPAGCPQPPLLLADLRHADNFVDVVTRILHVNTAMETVRLVVWDGSGNAADSDPELVQLLTNGQVSVPDHGVIIEIAMNSCWMIVQQMGYVDHFDDNWCRFRNLAITTPEPTEASSSSSPDFHVLRFREVSSLLLVPKDIPEVKTRLDLVNGVVSPSPSQPTDELAPDTNQSVSLGSSTEVRTVVPVRILKSIPVTPLASVVSTRQAPRKYHCHVRFVKMWPTEIIKIAKSKPGSSGEFVFSFVLSVEDDSGTLDAIVHGQDAAHFLHGIPACDLGESTSSRGLLEKRFARLFSSRSLHHCCIKSYTPPQQSSADSTENVVRPIRYRLFDTLLQC